MKLSEEQKQALLTKVEELVGSPNCSLCRSQEWLVSDTVFELREFFGGNFMVVGGAVAIYPVIPMTCGKCGNTVLLNAITVGVVHSKVEGDAIPGGEQPGAGVPKP